MKGKTSKTSKEELDYTPKIEDLPKLKKIIEELEAEDKLEFFLHDVDKKGKSSV